MKCTACVLLAALFWCSAGGPVEAAEESRIGRTVESFSLPDFRGKSHSLDEFTDSKAVVVIFLGIECPLVKLYGPRLAELSAEFEKQGVAFVGINSNLQDTITEMDGFARQSGIKFPILKDAGNVVADQFGALRTPEVFLLDPDRKIRYWGRIDDQYGLGASSGYARLQVERRDLAVAVEELLAGKPISEPIMKAPGCLIGRVHRPQPHGQVTYTKHVAPILQKNCVECHRAGELGPFALTSFNEVLGWADMIREVVSEERMPPWFANPEFGKFSNDCRLTEVEREQIFAWVDGGCPEGDPADLAAPRQFVEGWRIGTPDAVFYMSDEPAHVQAEGTIDYQYFVVDPGFTEDKWISAAECRPGNASVVHHIICFIQRDGGGERAGGASIGYAPGMPPRVFQDGVAMKIPAGSKLMFQMHYTANGYDQTDRSYVGFKFADPKTVRQEAKGTVSGNVGFRIPPGDGNFKIVSSKRFRRDTMLLSLLPHMHLRGKSFRYEVKYPDGTSEIVLDVPRYDFNWQLWYELAEPKLLPKGTRMTCTAYFDNSAENPFNPDPTAEITFGEQTWEEMMFGFMTTLDPNQDLLAGNSASAEVEEPEDDDVPAENVAF